MAASDGCASERKVAVSILALGQIGYGLAAREAVASVLQHTVFDVFLTCDAVTAPLFAPHGRLHLLTRRAPAVSFRPTNFLAKFEALADCLDVSDAAFFMQLDADAVLTRSADGAMVAEALGDADIAMAEQTSILGSPIGRAELRRHYIDHALAFLAPQLEAPPPDRFCFANSGVVLFRRDGLKAFLDWARPLAAGLTAEHRHGEHWIADQDYLQVWANAVNPSRFARLPWQWNHCEHWDEGFPRAEALIAHLSNFMNGPVPETVLRLRALRQADAPPVARPPVPRPPGRGPRTTFVVVSHNSAGWLDMCLEAAAPHGDLVVVDNASSDASPVIARRRGAEVLRNGSNLGFAAAANIGAKAARTPFVCFLNPDCLVTPPVVEAAEAALAEEPLQLLVPGFVDWTGRPESGLQPGYTRLKILADLIETRAPKHARRIRSAARVDDDAWHWPLGACIFTSTDALRILGGFDESYFCYMEDVEMGRAAAARGIAMNGLPHVVVHLGQHGAAIAGSRRAALMNEARFRYAARHHGRGFAVFAEATARLLGFLRKPLGGFPRRVRG
ncbi:glycosyltransferase [Aquibium microcysteis]|uniref:glycosyltransferase n=1 Tax=Aquibium microcysteis TaxID=675281 RepID=UPI00165D1A71|nr:glycosyltransferase [Aquibium microcysteis]